MTTVTRNLSDKWKVEISVSNNFGSAVGKPERRLAVSILDRDHYDTPAHRTVWYKSVEELERLRDALDEFIKTEKALWTSKSDATAR